MPFGGKQRETIQLKVIEMQSIICTKHKGLAMPREYRDLTDEECEYGGGFAWMPFCTAFSLACKYVVPLVTSAANSMGWIDEKTKNIIDGSAMLVGTATAFMGGIGFFGCSTQAALIATTATKVKTVVASYNVTLGLGKGTYDGIATMAR